VAISQTPTDQTSTAPASTAPASTAPASTAPASRSAADRLARQVLRIGDADPQALLSLKGSIWLSAVRCIIMYAVLPALAPVVGWIGVLARPLSILLVLAASVLSVHSLRRVWLADWEHRWAYTAFIVVVLTLLVVVLVVDVRALLAS
jgi:hypothetical protein